MLSALFSCTNSRPGICRRQGFGSVFVMLLTLIGLLAAPVPATADPAQRIRDSIDKVREVLAPYETQSEMTVFVGRRAERRSNVPGEVVISVWPLSKQESGWWPLAEVLDTGDRLNLICEFPVNGDPRSKDSCSVHRNRSNRAYYRDLINPRGRKIKSRGSGKRHVREELKASAHQLLVKARTAFELSTLVGDGPYICRVENSNSVCFWRADSGTYGHGTLAMSIEANFSKKIDLNCSLPADGTPRAPDSCDVYISSRSR